jgi:hypothetical protein
LPLSGRACADDSDAREQLVPDKVDPKVLQAVKELDAALAALKKSIATGKASLQKAEQGVEELEKSAGK